eukprot:scaffold13665_cov73-Skeletonema_marinoi.AAC.3
MSIGGVVRVLCLQTVVVTIHAFTTITSPSLRRAFSSISFAQNDGADAQQQQQQLSVEDELFLE